MSRATLWLLISLGSLIGGLIPSWLGASYISIWGIVGSTLGAFAGVYAFYKLNN